MPSLFRSAILLKGGLVIDPHTHFFGPADLLIEGGKIAAIEPPNVIPNERAEQVFALPEAWVIPGLVDVNVHLREPGREYQETIETGTRAAVAGGFTSIGCMPTTRPVNDNPYITAYIREKAKATASCRVFPIGSISKGSKGEELAEIGGMVLEGARAVYESFSSKMNSGLMRRAMDYSKAFGIPIISQLANDDLAGLGVMNEGSLSDELGLLGSPAAAEEIRVARDIALCRLTRAPVHLSQISTEIALMHLERAKDDGLPITAEVSPHHLILSEENLRTYDTCYKVCPPLRTPRDQEALQEALCSGLIDMVATNHSPLGAVEKAVNFDEAANGIIGLQTAAPITLDLVHQGKITPLKWVELHTVKPAKLLKIPHGTLEIGAQADITILLPDKVWRFTEASLLSKGRNSPFLGQTFRGAILATFVDGNIMYYEGLESCLI